MNTMRLYFRRCSIFSLIFFSAVTLADTGESSPWSNYFQLLSGAYSSDGLVSVNDKNENIESLESNNKAYEDAFLLPLLKVEYTLSDGQTTLYGGIPDSGVIENDLLFELGIRHTFEDQSVFSVAYAPKIPGAQGEVWEDPFLTGSKRTRTDTEFEGLRFSADYILGSPLSIKYDYVKQTIENEKSGYSLNSDLSAQQLKALDRESNNQRLRILFTLPLAEGFYLIPGIRYTDNDALGDSNSSAIKGFELAFGYEVGQWSFFGFAEIAEADYQENHPVFNKKRQDDSVNVALGFSFDEPFGMQDTRLDFIVSDSRRDSNIIFYDSSTTSVASGLTFQF